MPEQSGLVERGDDASGKSRCGTSGRPARSRRLPLTPAFTQAHPPRAHPERAMPPGPPALRRWS